MRSGSPITWTSRTSRSTSWPRSAPGWCASTAWSCPRARRPRCTSSSGTASSSPGSPGRSVRNALDRARMRQALRLAEGGERVVGLDDVRTLAEEDLRASRVFSGGLTSGREASDRVRPGPAGSAGFRPPWPVPAGAACRYTGLHGPVARDHDGPDARVRGAGRAGLGPRRCRPARGHRVDGVGGRPRAGRGGRRRADRARRARVRLTAAGHRYAGYARRVLGLLEEGAAAARGEADPEHGRVRLARRVDGREHLLPDLLATFRHLHPAVGVEVDVSPSDRVWPMLAHHEVDVVVAGRPPAASPARGCGPCGTTR